MKRFLAISVIWIIWIVGLCLLLNAAWAQTNTNASTIVTTSGALTITPAPVVQRVTDWLAVAKDWASGALVIITALLGWLANLNKNKATESGTIASVLIQEIQKLNSKQVKDSVATAARDAGVGDALHAKVKEETPSANPLPTVPFVEPAKPVETKP